MSTLCRNIELKAAYPDPDRGRAAIEKIGAQRVGSMSQVDTYFAVPHGRLKLREIDERSAELIWYDRSDAAEFRASHYRVVAVTDPAALKDALISANGLRVEVCKTRELWMYHNVRIHLDCVANLGCFVEFEAVMANGEDDAISRRWLDELHTAMGISQADHQAGSYSDLLDEAR